MSSHGWNTNESHPSALLLHSYTLVLQHMRKYQGKKNAWWAIGVSENKSKPYSYIMIIWKTNYTGRIFEGNNDSGSEK